VFTQHHLQTFNDCCWDDDVCVQFSLFFKKSLTIKEKTNRTLCFLFLKLWFMYTSFSVSCCFKKSLKKRLLLNYMTLDRRHVHVNENSSENISTTELCVVSGVKSIKIWTGESIKKKQRLRNRLWWWRTHIIVIKPMTQIINLLRARDA